MTEWILLRAAGIGAYVALFLSVAWGLVSTTGVVTKRVSKPASNQFHAVVASTGLALLGVHMVLLVVDTFMPFGASGVLLPMHTTYRPIATSLGVLAMYATVLVVTTSWVRKQMPTATWRAIHLLAVPAFILAMLHGVFAGTDTTRPWMLTLYGISAVVTLFLVLVRALTSGYRPPRAEAPPRRSPETVREPASAA
ncbi:MAG: ferric reductase-like transmembrane domain-containing protein [Actinomycetota bacterium]